MITPPVPTRPRLGMAFQHRHVGLYGGSFNPVHDGHLHVAQTALRAARLDALVWLVSPHNPLKSTDELADYDQRLAAVRQMARHRRFYVSDAEAQLGTRYSIDTIIRLQMLYPRTQFSFVMGADSFASLHLWRDWRRLMARLPILVVARPGYDRAALCSPAARGGRAWRFVSAPHKNISSTSIRRVEIE